MPLPIPMTTRTAAPQQGSDPPPPSWLEGTLASTRTLQDETEDARVGRTYEGYSELADTLDSMGIKRSTLTRPTSWFELPPPGGALDYDKVFNAVTAARARDPNAFKGYPATKPEFEKWLIERRGARAEDVAADSRWSGAGATVGRFLGGMAVDASDSATGGLEYQVAFGGGIIRQMLMMGTVNTLIQGSKETKTIRGRQAFGQQTDALGVAEDLGGAFFGGAVGVPVMHGAARVLGAGSNVTRAAFEKAVVANWDRLPEGLRTRWAARAKLPPGSPAEDILLADIAESVIGPERMSQAEKDGVIVLRREAEISEANPFRPTGAGVEAHSSRLAMAMADLATLPKRLDTPPVATPRPATTPVGGLPDFETSWRAVAGIEHGADASGRFLTSPKGAIGPAQLMPGTAPEAARLAGLPFDEARYKSDADYNIALGRAYYRDQLRRFGGDPVKAAAAYNAGPGSAKTGKGVFGAMARARKAGRPGEWEAFLPAETQKYLDDFRRRTGAAAAGEAPPAMPGEAEAPLEPAPPLPERPAAPSTPAPGETPGTSRTVTDINGVRTVIESPAPGAPAPGEPAPAEPPRAYTLHDPIDGGDAQEVRVVRDGKGNVALTRGEGENFQIVDVTKMANAGLSDERMIAQSFGADTSGKNVAAVFGSREPAGPAPGEAAIVKSPVAPVVVDPNPSPLPRTMKTRDGKAVDIRQFHPDEIDVDAKLMQFKSGGDENGVTARLRAIKKWNSRRSGIVTVWEALDGRRLIADGHQRLGLAKRLLEADPSQDIKLNAFVLREADGVSASEARVITALDNIAQGSGTRTDAAKVFREVGEDATIFDDMPVSDQFIKDGRALAKLSDEAFGAVVNEVIPEKYGALIGELAPDPKTHMALVRLLHETEPANLTEARIIVKQGLEAGFAGETQDELFGGRDLVTSMMKERARLISKAIGELGKLKSVFQTAVRNADALDAAGNRIDVGASSAEAANNAQALALVEKLALRKGNPINEIVNRAAERLANREPFARVLADTVKEIRAVDIRGALAGIDEPGAGPGAGGRLEPGGDAQGGIPPEPTDGLEPTAADLEAAGQGSMFSEPPGPANPFPEVSPTIEAAHAQAEYNALGTDNKFADPMGPALTAQGEQFNHDMKLLAAVDDRLFDFGDGTGPRTIAGKLAEMDDEDAAIAAIKGCLI